MASNTTLDPGAAGDTIVTKERTHDGDASKQQGVFLSGVSGSEGAYTFVDVDAGGGVEAAALRVTIASDSTGVLSVDDNGGTITVDNAGLTELAAAINASSQMDVNIAASNASVAVTNAGITTIAGAVSGTEMQVDVLTMPSTAVTNAGTFATQVDGAALTALQLIDDYVFADDAAFTLASSKTAVVGAIRDDSLAALTAVEGDVVPLRVSSTGALHVTGGGGGTEYTVDAAAPAAPTGATFVMERDDALSALTEIEGDWTNPRASANGALWTAVDGSVAVTNAGLTELAAAINASSQMDVNIAAGGVTGRAEDAAHASGHEGVVMLAVRRDTAAVGSDTDGDYSTINVDSTGRVHVNVGNTVTVASHAVTNAGTFAVQVDGSALTALQLIDNASIADDAAFTPTSTGVTMAGFFADETATDSVDEGDGGAARMTLDRKVIVTPYPHTAGGLTIFRSIDLDETEEEVKASAGQVYAVWATNTATTTRWLKFYNATAANTTVGTTTPVITIGIPGNTSDDISGNFGPGGMGIAFGTAITVAATTGVADADTGAPAANDVIVNIFYT